MQLCKGRKQSHLSKVGQEFHAGGITGHFQIAQECALHSLGESESRSVLSDSLQPLGICNPYSPWNSPGQNIGEGTLSLLQGIFPTQESNRGLLLCRWILYQLSCERSPLRIHQGSAELQKCRAVSVPALPLGIKLWASDVHKAVKFELLASHS